VLEARLRGRASDDAGEVARRMAAARAEISHWAEFDHLLVNEDLDECVESVRAVLRAARCATARSLGVAELARGMSGAAGSGDP
jgi:guanylate kinase